MSEMESRSLRFLYGTPPGRALLKLLTRPRLSRLAGRYLDSRHSRWLIPRAARAWGVNLAEFEPEDYASFNAFFTRRRRAPLLRFDMAPNRLVSPCDGQVSAYAIGADSLFHIKGSAYTPSDLLGGAAEAERFRGGDCLIFRLAPADYHRYHFIDGGTVERTGAIPGALHCVRPIACERYPVYARNSREWALMRTDHFGTIAQIEVGALLVGRIVNEPLPPDGRAARGQEKGRFEYGGSTIVLLFEPDRVALDTRILENMRRGLETPVRAGEGIGRGLNSTNP